MSSKHPPLWRERTRKETCRMTQLYDEGGVLYMYISIYTAGVAAEAALEAFEHVETAARRAALDAGGSLSHHHGVGKLRARLLQQSQAPPLAGVMHALKAAVDPTNVFAARNGCWSE